MKILALEFSSERRSVAVVDAPGEGASDSPGEDELRGWNAPVTVLGSAVETEPRNLKALMLIRLALQQARLEPAQVDCIAVGLGPGSYTGIRAGISIAQGWQLALPVKLIGISSVECIAAQIKAESRKPEEKAESGKQKAEINTEEKAAPGRGTRPTGEGERVVVLVDAQRNEFYLAEYEMLAGKARIIEPLRLATFAEVQGRVERGEMCVGPELNRWFAGARVVFPEAEMLARLASVRRDFVSGDKLAPIYLREAAFVKAPRPRSIE